ncbi:hypothetical protein OIV83_002619 [Microbotryomycetes sp. JL201]|nr:hypothetical protein OIV83_002619 [Microbotryomycetes sp. JL201]
MRPASAVSAALVLASIVAAAGGHDAALPRQTPHIGHARRHGQIQAGHHPLSGRSASNEAAVANTDEEAQHLNDTQVAPLPEAVGLDEALWSNKQGSLEQLEADDADLKPTRILRRDGPTPLPIVNPKWAMELNALEKRGPKDGLFDGEQLETKLLVVTRGKVTVTKTITITKTRKCDKGYTASGSSCVVNSGTTSSQTAGPTLPGSPNPTCWARYTNTDSGAVYGPGIGSFPMAARPTSFVTRKFGESSLTLDGQIYRVVGPNIYWLGLDENVSPSPSYPSKQRVREAMAIAVAMGANTVRSHTLGISTGNQYSVWPNAWQTNDAAFEAIDYAIWAARNYGLRLIIPLTDEHQYYHGGKYDFIRWAGLDTSNGYQFYTDYGVRDMFKAYIRVILEHVNQFTGVALKDDPTILAWETGNELGAWMLRAGAPTKEWTEDIAAFIKSFAPNQLVADGTDGLIDESGVLRNEGVAALGVDLVTDHLYPALTWLVDKDAGFMQWYTKNFFIGEFDWTNARGGDPPSSLYSILESQPYSGSMMWSVFGHDDQCCNYVVHDDGYSAYYPNGNSDSLQQPLLQLVQHWYRMRGLSPPSSLPAVACPQPELTK